MINDPTTRGHDPDNGDDPDNGGDISSGFGESSTPTGPVSDEKVEQMRQWSASRSSSPASGDEAQAAGTD